MLEIMKKIVINYHKITLCISMVYTATSVIEVCIQTLHALFIHIIVSVEIDVWSTCHCMHTCDLLTKMQQCYVVISNENSMV